MFLPVFLIPEMVRVFLPVFLVMSVRGQLQPCPGRVGWLTCSSQRERCVSPSELCDGTEDCQDGEDEAPSLCSSHSCSSGVRCSSSPSCLYTPHHQLCSNTRPLCRDGSDQAHCHHRQYTGCLTATNLGLRISACSRCYCSLLDRSTSTLTPAVYRSEGSSQTASNVTARICIDKSSRFMCNGVIDCIDGSDEDEAVCRDLQQGRGARRRGKHLSLEVESEGEGYGLGSVTVATTSVVLCLTVLLLSLVFVVLYRRNIRRSCSNSDFIQLEYRDSCTTETAYVAEEGRRFSDYWSLQNNKIVQEIGHGHFSRVYLARNLKSSELVALKILKNRSENDLWREAEILTTLKGHTNICQILGFNLEENSLVLEYCVSGSLRDHVSKLSISSPASLSPFPRWCYEIADAMRFVESMRIIHRDLALRYDL